MTASILLKADHVLIFLDIRASVLLLLCVVKDIVQCREDTVLAQNLEAFFS